jgi:hypothetical protein
MSTGPGIVNASDLEYSKPSCTCRYLEDHHAFNFLELAEDACGSRVHEHIEDLETRSSEARVFDVETATLLFRANQLDVCVATVPHQAQRLQRKAVRGAIGQGWRSRWRKSSGVQCSSPFGSWAHNAVLGIGHPEDVCLL